MLFDVLRLQAADYLAVGISELASISERRIERLVNHHLSGPRLKPETSSTGVIRLLLVRLCES